MTGDSTQPARPSDETEAELTIVKAIERGRADARAGRVTPHDEVVRQAREVIEAARKGR